MILIIGLGNPGKKYERTRHNLGFRVVDEFVKKNRFSDFRNSKKFNSLISRGYFKNKEIIIVKPQTFMNLSGQAVKKIISNFKCQMSNVLVVHDDTDLPLSKIRISKGRGAAGHKGVESIIRELKTKNFVRFRIGIRPNSKLKTQISKPQLKTKKLEKFVLENFTKQEEKIIKEATKKTVEAIEFSLKEGVEKAMNEFN